MPLYGTFLYGEGKYTTGWALQLGRVGDYRGYRFMTILNSQDPRIIDKKVDGTTSLYFRYLEENAILGFDLSKDMIFVMAPTCDDLQASDKSRFSVITADIAADTLEMRSEDFILGKELHWNIGMIPFNVDVLQHLVTSGNGYGGDGEAAFETLGTTRYTSTNMTSNIFNFPAGTYRVFARWKMQTGSGSISAKIESLNATYNDSSSNTSLGIDAEWSDPFDIVVKAADNVQFKFTRVGGIKPLHGGEVVIFPLANSRTMPLDIIRESMNMPEIVLTSAIG